MSPEPEPAPEPEPVESEAPPPSPPRAGGKPRDRGEERIMRAAHLIMFRRGRRPGARDWELQRRLGKDYPTVIGQLNDRLGPLDLVVREVVEPPLLGEGEGVRRFVSVLKGNLTATEARMCGWRIDNLAALAVAIGLVMAKQGKAPRDQLEDLLAQKFGRWRPMSMVDTFVRSGYLREDDEGLVSLDWRTYAEVDLRELMTRLLAAGVQAEVPPEPGTEPEGAAPRARGWEEPPEDEPAP